MYWQTYRLWRNSISEGIRSVTQPQSGRVITGLEDVLTRLTQARSRTEAGAILLGAAASSGYENVVIAHIENGALTSLPLLSLPDGFIETYIASGWERCDPVLSEVGRSRLPVFWDRLLEVPHLSRAERRMMKAAEAHRVTDGMTIPLHGPGTQCDLVSLSAQKCGVTDPGHRNIVAMIALQCLARYIELGRDEVQVPVRGKIRTPARPRGLRRPDRRMSGHIEPPFSLPEIHLRALVLVEAGERRWQMGLTQLASTIYIDRNTSPISDLERWGLVVDVPDDLRWRYYLAPSIIGRSYLRRSAEVERLRQDIWAREINRHEVPDGVDLE